MITEPFETATELGYPIDICTDCTYVIANGELPGDSEHTLSEHVAAMDAAQEGSTGITLNMPDYDDDPDGGVHFSWSSCDGCGSLLGGDRFPAVVWFPRD